jgi:hypothetical protein
MDGAVAPVSSDATPTGSNNGSAMNVDGGNRWQQHTTPKVRMFIRLNLLQLVSLLQMLSSRQ